MNEISEMLEDALKLISLANERKEEQLRTMHAILYGPVPLDDKENTEIETQVETDQPKKKPKHLSALIEDSDESTRTSKSNKSCRTLLEVNHETSLASKKSKSPRTNKKNASTANVEEQTPKASNGKELESAAALVTTTRSAIELMPPPPPAAVPVNASMSEQSFARPQRAAKMNCVKNLKEPPLNGKLRRPTEDEVRIKLEHEERASQAHEVAAAVKQNSRNNSKLNASTVSTTSQESVIVLPAKAASIVSISDQSDVAVNQDVEKSGGGGNSTIDATRKCSVRIKREKLSVTNSSSSLQETATLIESTTTLSTTTNTQNTTNDTTQTKKGQKKKKAVPKPIKVERLSEVEKPATPIAARTRHGRNSGEQNKNTTTTTNAAEPTPTTTTTANETVVIDKNERNSSKQKNSGAQNGNASNSGTPNNNFTMVLGSAPNDATYCTAAAATFVVEAQQATTNAAAGSDQTFDVLGAAAAVSTSQRSSDQSMATARDTLQPRADSLITEDESDGDGSTPIAAAKPAEHAFHKTTTTTQPQKFNTLPSLASKKMLTQSKSYNKMPVREIFNPLVPSPVKKKVEAFEHVAAANNKTTRNPRSRLAKNSAQFTPSSTTTATTLMSSSNTTTTPLIGKPVPNAATNGNFITPNCMSNAGKKLTASASKVMSLSKSNSAGNLKVTASARAPTAVRANSAEDFRRGLHQMAEERKKEREKKHLLAAQQREAKERERAERMAKAAKEREEKRLLKQQLAQQKERELQEIQRKLKQQEEALAAAAAAEAAAQKEKLLKINHGSSSAKARMPPPQPKSKYTFEMLHEDDSTDEEGKITYKRPAPPQWSLSHVRGPAILAEEHMPTEPIDFLFAVQPRTLDLKALFPTIDPRYLKRNSSVIWQTPPRYSELPKY